MSRGHRTYLFKSSRELFDCRIKISVIETAGIHSTSDSNNASTGK